MFKRKNRKGFTIVELVIVIAVIGILAAILIPTFVSLTNKANEASDFSLVHNLNTALRMEEAQEGKNKTLNDAVEDLDDYGYKLANLVSKSGENLLWDQDKDEFVINKGEAEYNKPKYWEIRSNMPDGNTNKRSIYAGNGWTTENVDITNGSGFDAGTHNVSSVSYSREYGATDGTAAHDVVIRTNSASTSLTIDAAQDTVSHFGSVGSLNIKAIKGNSYHEYGKAAFAEIKTGRIVLEEESEIKHIHVNANEEANGFNTVIIADNGAKALPEAITRDQVDVSEAKPVVTVESGSASETIYVYPYTDSESTKTGTTEQTTTQNTTIATDLGKLVLDNGSDAGEKAMSNNDKQEAKTEIVEIAQNEEEIEQAEEAGYEITHHDALEPTCTVAGHTAYDSYYLNNEEVKVGYKVIEALGHDVDPETGICNRCDAQVYVFKVGNALYKSNQFSAAWSAAKNSSNSFKILCDLTLNVIQADGRFTLDLNGKTLTLRGHSSLSGAVRVYGLTDYGGDLTIQNGTLQLPGTNNINYGIYSEGNLTVDNVTINSACKTTVYVDGLAWNSVGSANLTNVVINATHTSGTAYNAHSVSMYGTTYSPVSNLTNVTITSANDAVMINATNANLHSCNITASGRAAWIIFSATGNTIGTMTIDGETTLNAGSAYNRLNAQDGNTISILAGTYNFDPTAYVDDSAFNIVENDGAYIVSAK